MPWATTPQPSPLTSSPLVRGKRGARCLLQWECVSRYVPEVCMNIGGMFTCAHRSIWYIYTRVHICVACVYTYRHRSECPLPAEAERPLQQLFPSSLWLPQHSGGGRGGWARPLCSCSLHPPTHTLIASLRPVMNEVSEQETGVGQILHSPQPPSPPDPLPISAPSRTDLLPSLTASQTQPDPLLASPPRGWVPRQTVST